MSINQDLQASHRMLLMFDEANTNVEMVIDQFPGIFLIINDKYEVLRANREFLTLFDLDPEQMFRLSMAGFFRKKSWEIFAHNVQKLAKAGSWCDVIKFELGLSVTEDPDGDGRPFHWILTRNSIKCDGEGQLITVYGHDMTEVRETEKRLMEVFTSIPLGIFTVDRMGRIGHSYSSYLETMLDGGKLAGRRVDEVLFNPARASMDAEALKGIEAVLSCVGCSELDFPALEKTFPHEIFHTPRPYEKAGRWLKISYHAICHDLIIDQLMIILEDRTELIKAEQDILNAAKERERANMLQLESQAIYESAIRDPLTGLYTRLYMQDSVAALLAAHEAGDIDEVAMVIFDIDHFKHVNDTHGHKNGDLILSQTASAILRQSHEPEIPIRFGGEEFVVFLPANIAAATDLAERVRQEVEGMCFELGSVSLRVTISGGVASRMKGEALEDFMHRADQCLYQAKEGGRNRIVSAV